MKKYRTLLIIFIVFFCFFLSNITVFDYMNDSLETRIEKTLGVKPYSTIDFEDGYICFYLDTETTNEDLLSVTYLKKSIFSVNGIATRADVGNSYNYYINNKSITKPYLLPLNNFSNKTIYFSLCEEENAKPVTVNGKEVELYDIEIKQGDKTLNRKAWFFMGKDEVYPNVVTIQ